MKLLGMLVICSLFITGCGKKIKKIKPKRNIFISDDGAALKRKERAQITTQGLGKRKIIDSFVARVNGVNILASDLTEPRIEKNCATYSLEEAINEELLYQKAVEMKLCPNDLEVERRFVSIKDHNGFAHKTDDVFESWFKKETGLTVKKLKRQLLRGSAVDNVKNMYVQDKCFISSQAVEKYCLENPELTQEKYELRSAFVNKDHLDDRGYLLKSALPTWIELGWIEKSVITEAMMFVTNLKKGEMSKAIETDHGLQVFMLQDMSPARLKLVEERYKEVEKKLLFEKRDVLEKELLTQLKSRASLIYLS